MINILLDKKINLLLAQLSEV